MCKGTAQQNRAYCMKVESRASTARIIDYWRKNDLPLPVWKEGPIETGVCRGQGRRTDIEDATALLRSGGTFADMALEHTPAFVKYHSGMSKFHFIWQAKQAKKWRTLKVKVLWGPTGVGKTRTAVEEAGANGCDYYLIRKDDGKTIWWDGYNGEKNLIIDEMTSEFMHYKAFLAVLDGYTYRLPVKGGHKYALWDNVWITSSMPPNDWYPMRPNITELMRRIHEVVEIEPTEISQEIKKIESKVQSGGNTNPTLSDLAEVAGKEEETESTADELELLDCTSFLDSGSEYGNQEAGPPELWSDYDVYGGGQTFEWDS